MSGYIMYIGSTQMPVAPGRLSVQIKGRNKTLELLNDGETNILRLPGLTEISVTLLLPMYEGHPFASYPGGFRPPGYYLGIFEAMASGRAPAYFKLVRYSPANGRLFDTEVKVSLEDYGIDEDAGNGQDVAVSLNFKQYRDFGTKILTVAAAAEGAAPAAAVETPREAENAPSAKAYTVAAGDCLYLIAKKYYGDGGRWREIFDANKDKIDNPNAIAIGQELTIP